MINTTIKLDFKFTRKSMLIVLFLFQIISICSHSKLLAQHDHDIAPLALTETEIALSKYRASKTRTWDLTHTKLAVSFDWEKRYLYGQATLSLRPYFYEQDQLILDAKSMTVNGVMVDGNKAAFTNDKFHLTIDLNKMYQRTDTLTIVIDYISKPYERTVSQNTAIEEDRGLYFINADGTEDKPQQIWTQGETEANSVWFPTIDSPNEKCTQEMEITVKANFNTLSNGLMTHQSNNADGTRTDYWKMNQPHSPYLFMMTVGEFEITKDDWNGIPLAYHMEAGYGQYAKDIFGNTPEMMTFFSDILDYPYPWTKYDQIVVQDYVSGAMENTSASLFMEDLNVTKRDLIDYNWDDIIAHELFHQWFGDLVTCESWSNLTLNEGFASYSEYLWNEYKLGVDEANYKFLIEQEGYMEEAEEGAKNLIRYHYETSEDMFDAHSYNKGAAVLHMLRNYLGDDAFFAGLSQYLKNNAFQAVEVADLRIAFELVTGEDLNWFFDQWYFFAGHPFIDVRDEYKNDTLRVSVQQVQDTEHGPIYRLPVMIDIWKGDEMFSYPVIIEEATETYLFPMDVAPDVVIFDSQRQLLADIDHPKTPAQYLAQFMKDKSTYSRLETMDSLHLFENKKMINQLLNAALEDPFYIIREYALQYLMDNEVKLKKYESLVTKLLSDENSTVQSSAIGYVAVNNFKDYESVIRTALKNPSYMVIGAAIDAFTQNDILIEPNLLESFKKETNVNIVLTIASYFTKHPESVTFDWYDDQLSQLGGETLFYFIQMYAEKLLDATEAQKTKAIKNFEKIAMSHSAFYVRYSAFQALQMMVDEKNVPEIIEAIKANEKNEFLIKRYNEM